MILTRVSNEQLARPVRRWLIRAVEAIQRSISGSARYSSVSYLMIFSARSHTSLLQRNINIVVRIEVIEVSRWETYIALSRDEFL